MDRKRTLSSLIRVGLTVCVGFALACPAARAALSEQRPSPEHWEQWDYQLDESDARLASARVALSSPYSTLADLLLDLSHETGVALEATPHLAPVEIMAFGENSSLRGVMVSLSRMLDAYWVFPRGCAPAARRYLLVPYDTEAEDLARAEREEKARQLAYWAGLRPKLESRLEEYFQAFSLAPKELLARYEKRDPWLCADILDPCVRPLLEQLASLDTHLRENLLERGTLALPLTYFDETFRDYLEGWRSDPKRWGGTSWSDSSDRPPALYDSDTERWEHSVVTFSWDEEKLTFHLYVPDTGTYFTEIVHLDAASPLQARQALARLGCRELTPEYQAAMNAEQQRWADERAKEAAAQTKADTDADRWAVQLADKSSGVLERPVSFSESEGARLSPAEVLKKVARQCQITALAHYLPPDFTSPFIVPGPDAALPLGTVLERLGRRTMLHWQLNGRYLTSDDRDVQNSGFAPVPQGILDKWRRMVRPGEVVEDVDALASALAELSPGQLMALGMEIPQITSIPTTLWIYGKLDPSQRAQLAGKEELRLSDLHPGQQKLFASFLADMVPWGGDFDPDRAVLYRRPWTNSRGEEGWYLALRYQAPGYPEVRSGLFATPLRFER